MLGLSDDPSGHTAVILDDRCFQSIDQHAFHAGGQSHQLLLIDQIPGLPVGHGVESIAHWLEIHADSRGEAAKKETAGTKDAPELGKHGVKLRVVAGEVEDGAAHDDIGKVGVPRQLLNTADLEILAGQASVQRFG